MFYKLIKYVFRFSNCRQLTHLDLSCTLLNSDISVILDKIADQLTYFSIEECNLIVEENAEKVWNCH